MAYDYTFTVFTPTYNRVHTLERVFDSLCAQTFKDFEWLIVDDGSTDSTAALVERFKENAEFELRYIFQRNSGKHVATNRAVGEARGRFFLTLDSDDACVPEALERLLFYWNTIPDDRKQQFSAVTALCMDPAGRVIGSKFPHSPLDSTPVEVTYRYRVRGEKWGFQRTDVLRRHPFPVIEGEAFVTEALVWNAIGKDYRTRYVNDALRIYFETADQRADNLSNVGVVRQAQGRQMFARGLLNDFVRYGRYAPGEFYKCAANYARCSFHLRTGLAEQWAGLTNGAARCLWLSALPAGYLLSLRDRQRLR